MPNKTMDDLIYETDLHLPVATEKNGLPSLVFPSLEKTGVVRHLVSTKLGGVSTGFLSSLNFRSPLPLPIRRIRRMFV